MATQKNEQVNQNQNQEQEQVKMEQQQVEAAHVAPEVMQVAMPPEKKGGFFRDMGIGVKIGVGLVVGGTLFGVGWLIKKAFFGGSNSSDPVDVEGTVSETAEE